MRPGVFVVVVFLMGVRSSMSKDNYIHFVILQGVSGPDSLPHTLVPPMHTETLLFVNTKYGSSSCFQYSLGHYCKFGNFREGFIFAKLGVSGVSQKKNSLNSEYSLSFTDVGKSYQNREF